MRFIFCEAVTASSTSSRHIRPLEKSQDPKFTGGIDTDSLCGHVKAPYGWDLSYRFSTPAVDEPRVCPACRARYQDYLRVGDLYFEHEGKKYVRMRDVVGLEKQLLDGVARIEWYVLHRPGPQRPFFLLEFEMSRRLNARSNHWFKPEAFRIHLLEERMSPRFLQLLESPRSGASSSTGTSSGRKARLSVRKTTSGSRR